jgi:hypothetical protein
MDIAFFMGLVAGFLIGIGFSILICKHIKKSVYEGIIDALSAPKKRSLLDNNDDDAANFWKPKGWKPDE